MRNLECSRRFRRVLGLGGLVLAFAATSWAQPPSDAEATTPEGETPQEADPTPPMPVFRAGINYIRVDAIVTDGDGNHVADLQPGDFEVYEDDQLQTIEALEYVAISAIPGPDAEPPRGISTRADLEREAARSDVRVFVLFFDDYHVRWENGRRASMQLIEFLQRNLLPTDLVGIMYPLTPLLDLRLHRDHETLFRQIDNWFGRKYDYEPLNEFEVQYAHYPVQTVEMIRNHVTFSALRSLMVHLGGIREARKNVLLVSEGWSYYVPPQLRASNALNGPNTFENPMVTDPFAGDSRFEETQQFFQNSGLTMDMRELWNFANRFNTAFYNLDPRGLAVGEFDVSQPNIAYETNSRFLRATQDVLRMLADESDGRAIINANDFEPGLTQMLRDASGYYLIGYNSSLSPTDGKFHEIDVRVKRDGVNVRHRRGFWAMSERDAERALADPLDVQPPEEIDVALGELAEPRRGHLVRTWVGTSRGDDGNTRVTFVWEPRRGQDSRLGEPSRVLVTAMGETGGGFRGRVPERAPTTEPARGGEAELAMASFEVSPGALQMSLAVEGESGDVLDRDRAEIQIPDFTGPDLVLSTPQFVRARNYQEWQVLVDDWAAVPTPSREFRRTERVLVRFDAYGPGTEEPTVDAWLLNRRGDRIQPLSIQPAEDGHPYQVEIRPVGLALGEYVLELTVTTSQDELVELLAFRLRS